MENLLQYFYWLSGVSFTAAGVWLVVASLLLIWFATSFPIHVFYLLKKLRVLRLKDAFWKACPHYESTRRDWEDAVALHMPPLIGTLITCPICLSVHLACWTSVVFGIYMNLTFFDTFVIAATTPIISNYILKQCRK